MSAFLITASLERSKSTLDYLKKRALRIYPAFLVSTVFAFAVALPLSGGRLAGTSTPDQIANFVSRTLQLQSFAYQGAFQHNPYPGVLNGSIWSIPYEFWCYLGLLALGFSGVLRRRTPLALLFAASILIGVLFSIFQWKLSGGFVGRIFGYPPFWARLLPMYLAGVVAYRFRASLQLRRTWIVAATGLLLAAATLPHGWPLLFPIAGAYLILVAAFHPSIRLHRWSRFGEFSYGTYLYAFPLQQIIMQRIGHPVAPCFLFFLATPATLICAAISWHAVEKRFLKRLQRPQRIVEHLETTVHSTPSTNPAL